MSKPANSLQKASLVPKPSLPSKQWGQTERDSNLLFPKLQVILVLWNKALKPWPREAKRHQRCTLAKQRDHPKFFSVWQKPKGMKWETQEPLLKWWLLGEASWRGQYFARDQVDIKCTGVCPMQHIFCRHQGFLIVPFKKNVQFLLLQLFWEFKPALFSSFLGQQCQISCLLYLQERK